MSLPAASAAERVRAGRQAHVRLADELAECFHASGCLTVTWLNHSSAMKALVKAPEALAKMNVVGIDGIFLKMLVGATSRTSADLVIPELLPKLDGARIAVLGGTPESLAGAEAALKAYLAPGAVVAVTRDGYAGLPGDEELARILRTQRIDVVLLGLGAGLQEEKALDCARALERGLIMTCGGFLDQVQQNKYYPRWAYPLRLNWLVRVAREPRRLYRRYTLEAVLALRHRRRLRHGVTTLPGFARAEAMSAALVEPLPAAAVPTPS